MGHHGVDLSSNNTHPYDWATAHAALTASGGGQPFVWIKCTDGTGYVNPTWALDLADARAHGFAAGTYHFDEGTVDPGAQHRFYLAHDARGPWAWDFESPAGDYSAHCRAMSDLLPEAMVYAYTSERLSWPWAAARRNWLADPDNAQPGIPRHARQHAPRPIPGFIGVVDFNEWTGTEADFAAYWHTPAVPAPPDIPRKRQLMFVVDTPDHGEFVIAGGFKSWITQGADTWALLQALGQPAPIKLSNSTVKRIPYAPGTDLARSPSFDDVG